MRNSAEFSRAFKGTRGGSSRLLIAIDSDREENRADLRPVKVGFIIPRSVGNSVVRHRLYRQLRHIVRIRIDNFGPGDMVVIRVFPQARVATSTQLAADLDRCIALARDKAGRRGQ